MPELFPASLLLRVVGNIDKHYEEFSTLRDGRRWSAEKQISDDDRSAFTVIYGNIEELCRRFELVASSASLKKMLESTTYGDFFALGAEFSGRLKDELNERLIFVLSLSEGEKASSPQMGWEDAVNQFPSAIYDIEESTLCLALERCTASVFHSICSLEAAIRALSRCLGIQDPTKAAGRNWGAMLKTVKSEIDLRWPSSTNRLSGDAEFFDSAYAALASMQNPWKNATMHLDQKYTLEEAAHLHEIIRGFMRKIASRCDENGDPKA
jgi:hypothetical protein